MYLEYLAFAILVKEAIVAIGGYRCFNYALRDVFLNLVPILGYAIHRCPGSSAGR